MYLKGRYVLEQIRSKKKHKIDCKVTKCGLKHSNLFTALVLTRNSLEDERFKLRVTGVQSNNLFKLRFKSSFSNQL